MKADRSLHRSLILFFVLAIGLCALLQSCDEAPPPVISPPVEVAVDSTAIKAAVQHEKDSIFTAFYVQQYISNLIESGNGMIRGEKLFSDVMLPELYESYAYQLLWRDSLKRKHAIAVLTDASSDGLNPEDYHLSSILDLINLYEDDHEVRSGLDILITDGIILYGTHLLNGKTDPKTLEPTLSYEQRVLSDEALEGMRLRLIKGDVQGVIDDLRPPSKFYDYMMDGLSYYENLADSGAWKVVSISVRKLEPGSSYEDIPAIRSRMLAEGDLLLEDTPQATDSLIDLRIYDAGLQRAIERFQLRHGLNPDGIIGRGTVEAMNIVLPLTTGS